MNKTTTFRTVATAYPCTDEGQEPRTFKVEQTFPADIAWIDAEDANVEAIYEMAERAMVGDFDIMDIDSEEL